MTNKYPMWVFILKKLWKWAERIHIMMVTGNWMGSKTQAVHFLVNGSTSSANIEMGIAAMV